MKPVFVPIFSILSLFIACTAGEPEGPVSSPAAEDRKAATPADSLFQRAVELRMTLKYDSAASLFEMISTEYEERQNWEKYVACRRQIALCLWATHRTDQAVELAERMIEEASQKLGTEHIEIAGLYTVLGNVYADRRTQEDLKKSFAYFEKALDITRKFHGENHPALAGAYERLGIARYLAYDYPAAIPFYEKALTFLEAPSPENADTYAKIYNNLGIGYFGMGHFPKALENFQKAKFIIEGVLDQRDSRVVKYLNNTAEVQMQLGDFAEALLTLEEAWALENKTGEPKSMLKVYILGSFGDCYFSKGDYEKAAGFYTQCLEYTDPGNRDDVNLIILEHSNIGKCRLKLRQTERAFDHFYKAYALLEKYYDADNYTWVNTLMNLGAACGQAGNFREAEEYYDRALSITHRQMGRNHPTAGEIQTLMAGLHLRRKRPEEALDLVLKAERAYFMGDPTPGDPPSAGQVSDLPAYLELMELTGAIHMSSYDRSGDVADLNLAMDVFNRGLAWSDSLKMNLQSASSLQKAQQRVHSLSGKALDCLYLLWRRTGEPRYLNSAFTFFEKSKSEWLKSSAREWFAREFAGVPNELVERELALKSRLAYYRNRLKEDWLSPPSQAHERDDGLRDQLFFAKKQLDTLLQELEKGYPDYYRLKYDYRVVSLDLLTRSPDLAGADFVTYFWGEKSAYALSVAAGDIRWVKLPGPDSLQRALTDFQKAVDKNSAAWQNDEERLAGFRAFCGNARFLYRSLVEPVLSESNDRLILVPDGPLGRLPFQALLDADPGGQADYRGLPYLIRNRAVRYEYSATLLVRQDSRKSDGEYVGFCPTYEGSPGVTAMTRGDSARRDKLYPGYVEREGWGQLPFNEEEVEETRAMTGGTVFAGEKATEQAFRENAAKAKVLHMATHAFTHDADPDYSALIFAADPERPEDGQLHAYELYNLPLQAELAVLSACNTGAGKLQRGEGVMSLSRAFQYAGCPAVVMSLWPANDATAKEIIVGFFDYLKQNSPKSEALQTAAIAFLSEAKNDRLAHPFYWANFVAIGQDDPILFEQESAPLLTWLLLTAGLLGSAGLAFFYRRTVFMRKNSG
jgi:CHAT domain-containing protein/tetratricopeptide (TPR) repeat protein